VEKIFEGFSRDLGVSAMKVLLVNYAPVALVENLTRLGFEVETSGGAPNPEDLRSYDVVYFAKGIPPWFDDLMLITGKITVPLIYGFHAPFRIYHPYRPSNYVYNIFQLIKILAFRLKQSKVVFHVLNRADEHNLAKIYNYVYYCPLGVDINEFHPGAKSEEFTVVFVSPRYQKGADMVPHVIIKTLKVHKDIKFVITGRGFLWEPFFRLVEKYPNKVIVKPNMPRIDFVKLLSESHCLIFPSRYEGMPHVLLEALASGMGVVAFEIPGVVEILKEYDIGWLAKPFNVNDLVKGIAHCYRIWRSGEFHSSIVERSRKIASLYDWNLIVQEWIKMFRFSLEV